MKPILTLPEGIAHKKSIYPSVDNINPFSVPRPVGYSDMCNRELKSCQTGLQKLLSSMLRDAII